MPCVLSTQAEAAPSWDIEFPVACAEAGRGLRALAAPSFQAPTKPPLLPLSYPHSLVRSISGARINLFQGVVAAPLGGFVAGIFFFSKRHFYPMLLDLEDSAVSGHLLSSDKQKGPWLLGPTFLSN